MDGIISILENVKGQKHKAKVIKDRSLGPPTSMSMTLIAR